MRGAARPSMNERTTKLSYLALPAFLGSVLLLCIDRYGVPVWHEGHFIQVSTIRKLYLYHVFDFSEFFRQYDVHRLTFSLILTTALAGLTDWNPKAELLLAPISVTVSALLVLQLQRKTCAHLPKLVGIALYGTATCCLYSLTQWRSWLRGNHLHYFLLTAVVLGVIVALSTSTLTLRRGALAALLCLVASFTFTNGLLSWMIALPLLLYGIDRSSRTFGVRRRILAACVWLVLWAAVVQAYYWRYRVVANEPDYQAAFHDPGRAIAYFALYIGKPLSPLHDVVAIALGAAMMVILLYLTFRRRLWHQPQARPWLALFAFVALSGAMATIGRTAEPFNIVNRYIPFATPGVIAWFYLLALAVRRPVAVAVSLSGIAGSIIVHSVLSLPGWERHFVAQRQGLACLQVYEVASPDCLRALAPALPEAARRGAAMLEELGYLQTFRLPPQVSVGQEPAPEAGAWESARVVESGALRLDGWAVDDDCSGADHVVVTPGNTLDIVGHTVAVIPRPGLRHRFGDCAARSGWSVVVNPVVDARDLRVWRYDESRATLFLLGAQEKRNGFDR